MSLIAGQIFDHLHRRSGGLYPEHLRTRGVLQAHQAFHLPALPRSRGQGPPPRACSVSRDHYRTVLAPGLREAPGDCILMRPAARFSAYPEVSKTIRHLELPLLQSVPELFLIWHFRAIGPLARRPQGDLNTVTALTFFLKKYIVRPGQSG